MNRNKPHITVLMLLSVFILSLTGCVLTGSRARTPDQVYKSPENLPKYLGVIKIFLTRKKNNQVSGFLTSLDREYQSEITLEKNGRELRISRDSTLAAYSKVETIEGEFRSSIRLLDLENGTDSQVILWSEILTDSSITDPNFYPEMEKLIFSINWNDKNTIGLGSIGLDGTNYHQIDTPLHTFSEGPVVSLDGAKILVLCEGMDLESGKPGFMLCIMANDGSHRIRLTTEGNYHGTYLFSPDSKSIIYSEDEWGGILGLVNHPRYEIKRIEINGQNEHTILEWHRAVNVLALSRDGTEIIFMDRFEEGEIPRIFIVDAYGQNLRHLAYFDEFLTDWYGEN